MFAYSLISETIAMCLNKNVLLIGRRLLITFFRGVFHELSEKREVPSKNPESGNPESVLFIIAIA